MAVYSRGTNLPATTGGGSVATVNNNGSLSQLTPSQPSPLASKDLGTIIIKTLETVADSLSDNDVPVSYKDVERAVTQGVNKSDLVKKGLKGGSGNQLTAGSAADKALAEKYEQDKYIKWQEWQKKLQKEEERDRERLKQQQKKDLEDMKRKVDETWNSIATSLDNPLKGISNLLDNTIKNFSSGFLKGYKDAKNKNKGGKNEEVSVGSVTPSPEVKPITDKLEDLNDLITDNFDEIKENQEVMMDNQNDGKDSTAGDDELADLINDSDENTENAKDKQKSDEQKANEADKKKRDEKQLNATQSVGYAVGNIVGTVGKWLLIGAAIIGVGSQVLMFIKGKLYKMLEESPAKWDIRIAKLRANLEAIPEKIKLTAEQVLSKVRILGQPIFGSLSKDEKKQLKELEKDKDIKAYKNQQQYLNRIDEELANRNDNLGIKGVNIKDFDLNTTEGQTKYKNVIRARMYEAGYSEEEINNQIGGLHVALTDRNVANAKLKSMEQNIDPDKLETYLDLKERSSAPRTKEYYEEQEAKLDAKTEARTAEILSDSAVKRAEKGEYTQTYKATLDKEGYGGAVTMAEQKYEDRYGKQLNTAPLTERETWLKEKYEPWENAWKDFGKNMKMDLNIETQRPARRNALNTNGNQ